MSDEIIDLSRIDGQSDPDKGSSFSGSRDKELEKIRELMEKNTAMTEEILDISRRTKKYIFWGNVSGWVKILFVLAPIILAIIYLPPIIKDAIKQIQRFISENGFLN